MELYVATFIIVKEERWFDSWDQPVACETDRRPDRCERSYYLRTQFYAAPDAEAAYAMALEWYEGGGFEDANHDGEGDLTVWYSSGIFDMEKTCASLADLGKVVCETYGMGVGYIDVKEIQGIPQARRKDQLGVFSKGHAYLA